MVHAWARDYVKYNRHDVEPAHIFLLNSKGTDKFHLVREIYSNIKEKYLYCCEKLKNPELFNLGKQDYQL